MLADNAAKPAKRKLSLSVSSPLVEAPAPGAGDPTELGGALRVANPASGGDEALFLLPASGWKGLGKPAGQKGWLYKDPRGALGPCSKVVVKPGKSIQVACKGAGIPFTLDEDAQGEVGVSLTLGDDATQCLLFGGTVQNDRPAAGKKKGVFQAKNAPAPASCPLP